MEGPNRFRRRTLIALTAAITCAGVAGYAISRPVAIPRHPKVTPTPSPTPQPTPSTPSVQPAPDGFSVAADPASGQTIVFGGSTGAGNDTWIWAGGKWAKAAPSNEPPAIAYGTAAYDPALGMVLLAGGEPYFAPDNDGTWGWNGSTWLELDADTTRPPIGGGTMAWDPALQEMVMVTGTSPTDDSDETWVWATNQWVHRVAASPFRVDDYVLGYDPTRRALLAFTCCEVLQNGASAETGTRVWKWDGSLWQPLASTVNEPAATLFGLSEDPTSQSLLLFGQSTDASQVNGSLEPALTWRLKGNEWTALGDSSAPHVLEGEVIETPSGLRLVGSTPFAGSSSPFRIWAWSGIGWRLL
jgi:hypothetical protein